MGEPCRVCGEPTSEHSNATCNACMSQFHLALRQDIPGKDCGQVWIDDEMLALQFLCTVCWEEMNPPAPAPKAVEGPAKPRRYVRHEGTGAARLVRTKRDRPR